MSDEDIISKRLNKDGWPEPFKNQVDSKKVVKAIQQFGHITNEEELNQGEISLVLKYFYDSLTPKMRQLILDKLTSDGIQEFLLNKPIMDDEVEHI